MEDIMSTIICFDWVLGTIGCNIFIIIIYYYYCI